MIAFRSRPKHVWRLAAGLWALALSGAAMAQSTDPASRASAALAGEASAAVDENKGSDPLF